MTIDTLRTGHAPVDFREIEGGYEIWIGAECAGEITATPDPERNSLPRWSVRSTVLAAAGQHEQPQNEGLPWAKFWVCKAVEEIRRQHAAAVQG